MVGNPESVKVRIWATRIIAKLPLFMFWQSLFCERVLEFRKWASRNLIDDLFLV